MEIKKYYCDRCKKEITEKKLTLLESFFNVSYVVNYHFKLRRTMKGNSTFELCQECYSSFLGWCEDTKK